MRKTKKLEEKFFAELKKVPVVQVACEKIGISRQSVYRWRRDDKKFKEKMEEAINDGIAFVNDMSESQLLTKIREGDLPAVRLWLTHNHERYSKRIKVEHSTKEYLLSEEQKENINNALEFIQGTNQSK